MKAYLLPQPVAMIAPHSLHCFSQMDQIYPSRGTRLNKQSTIVFIPCRSSPIQSSESSNSSLASTTLVFCHVYYYPFNQIKTQLILFATHKKFLFLCFFMNLLTSKSGKGNTTPIVTLDCSKWLHNTTPIVALKKNNGPTKMIST